MDFIMAASAVLSIRLQIVVLVVDGDRPHNDNKPHDPSSE